MVGVDFRPVSGDFEYAIQFSPDQQRLPAAPIQIINDRLSEGTEAFSLSLRPASDAVIFNYDVLQSRRSATIFINDDDRKSTMNMNG